MGRAMIQIQIGIGIAIGIDTDFDNNFITDDTKTPSLTLLGICMNSIIIRGALLSRLCIIPAFSRLIKRRLLALGRFRRVDGISFSF